MVSGQKKFEKREPSPWIKSRLKGRSYQFVKFTNGYGSDKPFFICEYEGYVTAIKEETVRVSSFFVNIEEGDYIIKLGKVLNHGNLKSS